MAKRESKPSAQTVTEYVLKSVSRRGDSQGVFSHSSEAAARAVHARCVADDHANGCVREFSLVERTVAEDGDVTEKELSL